MYFRREAPVEYAWCDAWIEIQRGGSVRFDTYFNGFSAEKWFKYSKIQTVTLTLRVRGQLRVTLMRLEKHGGEILTEYTGEYLCATRNGETKEFTFPFQTPSAAGMYCFSLYGVGAKSAFYGGHYDAILPEDQINPVKLALAICTFRRERFVETNLRLLRERFLDNPDSPLRDGLEVFIADNARTLDAGRLSSDKIHIFPNKNAGGTGGFARCLIEIGKVRRERGLTHVLLMDDDILLEPEAIFRTRAMLACLKDAYRDAFIGGAMLRLDQRCIQTESGALWNGGELVSLKSGLDLREPEACLLNEIEECPQFNAWWFCAFPAEIVREDNLPMPLFIRGDDVEYGLRNLKHLILMNGICVWHEPFEYKYASYLYYYILRNRLIDNALHQMVLPKKAFEKILWRQVMDELRLYRYKNAELLMRGVEDFLRGPGWLKGQDGEALHQEILQSGYQLRCLEDMEERVFFQYSLYEAAREDKPDTVFWKKALNRLTINGTYLQPRKEYAMIPTVGAQQSSVYRVRTVLHYDAALRKAFLTRRDPAWCRRCVKRLRALYRQLDGAYDAASARFAAQARELTGLDFWKNYLNLENS